MYIFTPDRVFESSVLRNIVEEEGVTVKTSYDLINAAIHYHII